MEYRPPNDLRLRAPRSTCPPETYLRYCPVPRLKVRLQSRIGFPPESEIPKRKFSVPGSQFSVKPERAAGTTGESDLFSENWELGTDRYPFHLYASGWGRPMWASTRFANSCAMSSALAGWL
jgi:hypothetical protein